MTSFDNLSSAQKIRAALNRDVINICKETCHFLGLEVTKPAMEVVAELLFRKLSTYAADLEAFAKHAKRITINSEDVKLLVRRNPSLKCHLNKLAPNMTPREKPRKSSLPVMKKAEASSSTMEQETLENQNAEKAKKEKEQLEREQREAEEREMEKLLEQQAENMSVDDVIDLTI